jgi:hypothetical protein
MGWGAAMMKLPALAAFATCCCALFDVPVAAQSCDERYPESCPAEVSTTVVRTKGDAAAIAPRSSRRTKGASKRLPKAPRLAAARVSLPRPSPRSLAASEPMPLPRPSPRSLAVSEPMPLPPPSSPVTDLPATAGLTVDTPVTDLPATVGPTVDTPVTELPATAGPTVDAPVTDLPATTGSTVDTPVADLSATAGPTVDETLKVLTVNEGSHSVLGRAFIKLRDHILGFVPRD